MRRVKELKEERGVTQEELAYVLGVSQQRVSKLLSNKSQFYPEEIRKCANYFHVTSDYLLGLSDFREEITDEIPPYSDVSEAQKRVLVYLFSLITDKQRKVVLDLLETMAGRE